MSDPASSIYARLLTKEPIDYCEWRAVQESDSVQLSTSLTKNQIITSRFTLPFSAQSADGIIKRITVIANDIVVWDFPYDTAIVDDAKSIRLNATMSGIIALQIIAVDSNNRSKTLTLSINIWTSDTDKPTLDLSTLKVSPVEAGGYSVSFGVLDKTSGVGSTVIKLPDGTKQTYKWTTIRFSTATLWVINYAIVDLFGNQTDGTLDLATYVPVVVQ
jgi:hypothetical protein